MRPARERRVRSCPVPMAEAQRVTHNLTKWPTVMLPIEDLPGRIRDSRDSLDPILQAWRPAAVLGTWRPEQAASGTSPAYPKGAPVAQHSSASCRSARRPAGQAAECRPLGRTLVPTRQRELADRLSLRERRGPRCGPRGLPWKTATEVGLTWNRCTILNILAR